MASNIVWTSTLKDAFYNTIDFEIDFEDQNESDSVVTELESLLGVIREDFNIYPEERSRVFGHLLVQYNMPGIREEQTRPYDNYGRRDDRPSYGHGEIHKMRG
jgi:DNA topoisomerase-6 subunit A